VGEFENFCWLQSGFPPLRRAAARTIPARYSAWLRGCGRKPWSQRTCQSLPPVDDAFAFQFLVSALDRDDADQQIFRERAKRGQRRAGLEAAFADFTLQLVGDLLIKRAIRRREKIGPINREYGRSAFVFTVIHDINSKSKQYFCGLEAWNSAEAQGWQGIQAEQRIRVLPPERGCRSRSTFDNPKTRGI